MCWVKEQSVQRCDSLFPTMPCISRLRLGEGNRRMECWMAIAHLRTYKHMRSHIQELLVPTENELAYRWAHTGSSQLWLLPVCWTFSVGYHCGTKRLSAGILFVVWPNMRVFVGSFHIEVADLLRNWRINWYLLGPQNTLIKKRF